jgi:hypothetical protein
MMTGVFSHCEALRMRGSHLQEHDCVWPRVATLLLIVSILLMHGPASAQGEALPPRAQWRASSSAGENPALASAYAIDGDIKTRWGGSFSPGHWLQVDFGRIARVGGVVISWDSGFTESYLIQSSLDGRQWQTASDIDDGFGVRPAIFGMLMREGIRVGDLPTASGVLTMSARQQDGTLRVTLAPGLRPPTCGGVAVANTASPSDDRRQSV